MKDSLNDRMKEYEATTNLILLRHIPVIIRADGKAFHTWVKNITPAMDPSLNKGPFSYLIHNAMIVAIKYCMENIQNVQLAYTQSDEVTFFLHDWNGYNTQQWFNGNVQKIVSVTSSLLTAGFNKYFFNTKHNIPVATFDTRVFQLPKEEVINLFIWRQQDASRNSINMLGRYYFSHKRLNELKPFQIQDLLMNEHQINWDHLNIWMKRGSCVLRKEIQVPTKMFIDRDSKFQAEYTNRTIICEDDQIPIFTQDRNYIERFLNAGNN